MQQPTADQFAALADVLTANGLPTEDLADQDLSLFLVDGNGDVIDAVGGLERCGDTALLRSVATAAHRRGQGLAQAMVAALEGLARQRGIHTLWLLTETAEGFFYRLGYRACDRAKVPDAVRASRQFSALCPDSATVMCKRLGAASSA